MSTAEDQLGQVTDEPADNVEEVEDSETNEPAPGKERMLRHRAQAAEAKVTSLTARLAAHDQRSVEAAAAEYLTVPGDLFKLGNYADLSAIPRDEDGEVDLDAVRAEAERLIRERPGLAPSGRPKNHPGVPYYIAGKAEPRPAEAPSWADALRGKH